LSQSGNLKLEVKAFVEQANKALNNLLVLFKRTHMNLWNQFSLFDIMAVPIAMCASEVWGRYGTYDIDRLHMNIY